MAEAMIASAFGIKFDVAVCQQKFISVIHPYIDRVEMQPERLTVNGYRRCRQDKACLVSAIDSIHVDRLKPAQLDLGGGISCMAGGNWGMYKQLLSAGNMKDEISFFIGFGLHFG
jgi:hypothetical protein